MGIESLPIKIGSPTLAMPGYDVQVLSEDGNHEIYIKPLPLKNVPNIINDYIQVNLQKNYLTKLVAANIKLF